MNKLDKTKLKIIETKIDGEVRFILLAQTKNKRLTSRLRETREDAQRYIDNIIDGKGYNSNTKKFTIKNKRPRE